MKTLMIGAVCLLLFFVLLIGRKGKKGVWLERLSVFWFRVALSIFVLYLIHLACAYYGTEVTINLFSIITVAILGFPGIGLVLFLSFLK
ncbi:MAG: pro-sigmaK processing inhibitor BofA family protein [Lysinibacillus sp.]